MSATAPRKLLQIRLPADAWRKLRLAALNREMTVTALVAELVRSLPEEKKEKSC